MVELALIRHGRTAWNRDHRLQGRTDVPLDQEGLAEVETWILPPPWDRAQLIASPLSRAKETAQALAHGRPVEIAPRLSEMNFGAWEGKRGADLLADPHSGFRHVEEWGWAFEPPGGEAPQALRNRLQPLLCSLSERDHPVLAITHIGVIRVLLAMAHDWDFRGAAPFRVKRGWLYPLRLTAQGTPYPSGPAIRLDRRPPGPARLVS
ncbi:MAG: histidine phosphatase family protein [Pseudomonadota bacterium]